MTFRYRYVPFGTVFTSEEGSRRVGDSHPYLLYQNELALDVGGTCWRFSKEKRRVLDHHFFRENGGQYPSAAAAVLHNAKLIWDEFGEALHGQEVVWLVTHRQTDFDALCSMYLARRILQGSDSRERIPHDGWDRFGLAADGWLGAERINWFMPALHRFSGEPDRQWPALLAAYAACVDNCKRVSCPKNRALHSILYAALARGRDYLTEESGALEFFQAVEKNIVEAELNPLFDSVLENSSTFEPELMMLDREVEAYQRDIKRSRRAIVYVPKAPARFEDWFPTVEKTPLLKSYRMPEEVQLQQGRGRREQVDGCYLRDPECLLFKEWARNDTETPSMGQGFLFTAIAYSNQRPDAAVNTTDYFFALDPERAEGRHLYNIWVRLQSAEINVLFQNPDLMNKRQELDRAEEEARQSEKRTTCRQGFEMRAATYSAYFDDPWFDGSNYNCTIVATPNRGTFIAKPGSRGDLTDDQVARIVQEEIELAIYDGNISMSHFPKGLEKGEPHSNEYPPTSIDSIPPPPLRNIRFAMIKLKDDVDLTNHAMAEQTGRMLWRILHGEAGQGVPTDFLDRHLLININWVGVWSRHGAIIAYKAACFQAARDFQAQFKQFGELYQEVDSLTDPRSGRNPSNEDVIRQAEPLMRKAAQVRYKLGMPENRLPSRFFEATQLGEVLQTVRDVATAKNIAIVAHVQRMVEYIEIFLVSVYAAHLTDMLFHGEYLVSLAAALGAIATAWLVLERYKEKLIVSWFTVLWLSFTAAFLSGHRRLGWLVLTLTLISVVALVAAFRRPSEQAFR